MRDEDDMAGLEFRRCRAHALRVEPLQVRVDGAVILGNDIPGRNRFPRRLLYRGAERGRVDRLLRCCHHTRLCWGQVSGKHVTELAAIDEQEPCGVRTEGCT